MKLSYKMSFVADILHKLVPYLWGLLLFLDLSTARQIVKKSKGRLSVFVVNDGSQCLHAFTSASIGVRDQFHSGGGGGLKSAARIFSPYACPKIKWFCPNSTWFFARKWLFEEKNLGGGGLSRLVYTPTVKPRPEAHMDMILFEVFLKSIDLIPQQQILQQHYLYYR